MEARSKNKGTMNQTMPRIAMLVHELAQSVFANIRFEHIKGLGWAISVVELNLSTTGNKLSPLDAMYEFEDLLIEKIRSKVKGYERCRAPHQAEAERLNELIGLGHKTVESCDQAH